MNMDMDMDASRTMDTMHTGGMFGKIPVCVQH